MLNILQVSVGVGISIYSSLEWDVQLHMYSTISINNIYGMIYCVVDKYFIIQTIMLSSNHCWLLSLEVSMTELFPRKYCYPDLSTGSKTVLPEPYSISVKTHCSSTPPIIFAHHSVHKLWSMMFEVFNTVINKHKNFST